MRIFISHAMRRACKVRSSLIRYRVDADYFLDQAST